MRRGALVGDARVLLACLLAMTGVHHASADIALTNKVGFATRTVGASELGGFSALGADKRVVTIGGEGVGNGVKDNNVTFVTYGGVPMLPVVERFGRSNRGNEIWYLDDVTVTGGFVITFAEGQGGLGFGAYALTGTAPGFAATAKTTAESGTVAYNRDMTLTTTVAGEFVVAAFARNNIDTGGIGVEAPLIQLFYGGTDGSSAAQAPTSSLPRPAA